MERTLGTDKDLLEEALQEGRVFRMGQTGFPFAVQVPDNSVGRSGSRCSNCNSAGAYCHELCRHCGLPFIGPFGFPQLPQWLLLSWARRKLLVEEIYCHKQRRGRLGCLNVPSVPLSHEEVGVIRRLQGSAARIFLQHHGIEPGELVEKLLELAT